MKEAPCAFFGVPGNSSSSVAEMCTEAGPTVGLQGHSQVHADGIHSTDMFQNGVYTLPAAKTGCSTAMSFGAKLEASRRRPGTSSSCAILQVNRTPFRCMQGIVNGHTKSAWPVSMYCCLYKLLYYGTHP